jgi:hypothetical protein
MEKDWRRYSTVPAVDAVIVARSEDWAKNEGEEDL